MDEGYIKFEAVWEKAASLPQATIQNLNHWRQIMYQNDLIGAYEDGIGFGNISERLPANKEYFVISGSATGNFETLNCNHYSIVIGANINQNQLFCQGPIIASSESMSHAVIFQTLDWVNGVIHIHHQVLWEQLLFQIPTTPEHITYGTPEMAESIIHLIKNTNLPELGIFAMAGHQEGIFAFGTTLEAASDVIMSYFK